ncbi:MAG: phytanoyl-CoA dioxygenase family protein [Pegethrix bostrychoides GSE-TBD4-15B]|jgi:ectoine hydroxylase-related dioxygenase (phytanoyl-CoA dioxygenase family)|uniref:Phytanoyl-CoA dioxygenase family protein n=1 Tax=Pegethrix bostrychoides GSE-TBD4-15B TaxID=2839662 RepID=A0A951P9F4_9CYAN|nr:phytanoyl-CoA dioxygenase family protein [Pegethrix bostrychoides GSE-TBD4-15B]
MTEKEAAHYLELSNQLEDSLGGCPEAIDLTQVHLSFRWAYDLATDPRILDVVEDLIGHDILIWATSIFSKHEQSSSFVGWHQDEKYWGLDSSTVVSVWVALSKSDVYNGAMKVIPKTHLLDVLPHLETQSTRNMLSRGQEVKFEFNDSEVRHLVLNPGQASLHNIRIIHGSEPNNSNVKRVGFAIRYIAPSVKQLGEKTKAVLARGIDNYRHFELAPPPEIMQLENAVNQHRIASQDFLLKIARSYRPQ